MGRASGPIRITPWAVAEPRDEDDLSILVSWAGAEGIPLHPRGAGTGMPGGNVGAGVSVDLSGWNQMGPVDSRARSITVGPGTVAARVDTAARRQGLRPPPLPSSAKRCTLGGMVANNAAGARSFAHGAIRSWVEGLRIVLPDGEVVTMDRGGPMPTPVERVRADAEAAMGPPLGRSWPRVLKNASGYALDHFLPEGEAVDLFVGSEGTLGFVTGVRLRLRSPPAETRVMLLPLARTSDLAAAVEAARAAGATACEFFAARFLDISGLRAHPEWADVLGEAAAVILIEVSGAADAVHEGVESLRRFARDLGLPFRLAETSTECDRLWQIRHAASPVVAAGAGDGLISMQFIEDSVVHPDHLSDYLGKLGSILEREETDAVMFGHAGDGNVHVNPLIDVGRPDWRARVERILDDTVTLVASLGGTLSGEHGDGRIRGSFHEQVFGARNAAAFRAVKRALDPLGICNPGVIVPLVGQDPLAGLSPEPRGG